jgi:hypothetical protein
MAAATANYTVADCAEAADLAGMIAVYEAAFRDNYFTSLIFPPTTDPESKKQWASARFRKAFGQPELHLFEAVEAATGKLVAWTKWTFPHVVSEEEQSKKREAGEVKVWPEGANTDACEAKFGGLDRFREKFVKADDMYREFFFYFTLPFFLCLWRCSLNIWRTGGGDSYIFSESWFCCLLLIRT